MNISVDQGKNVALPLLGFPGVLPVAADFENFRVGELQRLLGFWFLWHMYGGFNGLVHDAHLMSDATAYRHMTEFRNRFSGIEVYEYYPNVTTHHIEGMPAFVDGDQS